MKSIIRWAITNAPGMNVMMIGFMLLGAFSLFTMRREVFPEFELEVVMVSVPYPGSTPEDVESGICQKIEEAVRSIDGIKQVTSIAQEGAGFVLMELRADIPDVQKVLNEISREVERIPTFPDLAEDPEVQQITFRDAAIRVAVIGPASSSKESEAQLREVTERVRDEILQLKAVSSASIMGAKPYQIDVEISEKDLRKYGLSLGQVADIIRRHNVELPGGQLKAEGQEILLRAKNRGRYGSEISSIPVLTQANGVVLTVGDLGTVKDEFEDISSLSEINGLPAMVVNVERTKSEDLLAMVDAVKEYVATAEGTLPEGYRFELWGDTSTDVRDRINLLVNNGLSGLVLVFIVLALFLELRLAFWVALGIPSSILGAGVILGWGDQTLNMLSLFAFLMTLGIVVDDAIVIGENIHSHRQMGKPMLQAAMDGTYEVWGSVAASVTTTIIAFMPMFFVSGVMGKFMAVIPFAVIAMLLISLVESTLVLPCHLAHPHNGLFRFISALSYPVRPLGFLLAWLNRKFTVGQERFADRVYLPILRFSLHYPLVPLAFCFACVLVTVGMVRGGVVPTILFPKTDNNNIRATVSFPDGTPMIVTDQATKRMEEAIRLVSKDIAEKHAERLGIPSREIYRESEGDIDGPVRLTFRQVGEISSTGGGPAADSGGSGSHVGQIYIELYDTTVRDVTSEEIIQLWREKVGDIVGADSIVFGSTGVGPGGKAIEFKLLAPADATEQLSGATELVKKKLADFAGVYDIMDDNSLGKWEFQFKVKEQALSTGITPTDLGETVRNAYYGAEVMRLQRGRHEVKLMVRYPTEERRRLADFQEIRVRTQDGSERPITELAEIDVKRGFSEINRVDQKRSITISADLDETKANGDLIIASLQNDFLPEMKKQFPDVSVKWEGQREQSQESVGSLMVGFVIALVAMYMLLVVQFRSYAQPLIIMGIIPFGMIGAVWGHAFLQLPLTLFSMFGLVALAGVVVNDSIVLIDFINHRVREGVTDRIALAEAGRRRFRPVLLTSMTTIAGLLPLLAERSFQAQLLIPMAASLAFGLMLSTALVLILVPVYFQYYLWIANAFGFSPHAEEFEVAEPQAGSVYTPSALDLDGSPRNNALPNALA